MATLIRTDMPLALATFAAGLLMFEKVRTRTVWTMRDRIALFAALTAAMFIKWPVVWAFVLPPLVLYQLRRRWRPDFPNALERVEPVDCFLRSCSVYGLSPDHFH